MSVNLNSATLYDETDRVCSLTGSWTVLQTRRDSGVDHWRSRVEPGGGESPATTQSHHQDRQQGAHSPEHRLYLIGWRWFCSLSWIHFGSNAGSVLVGFVVFSQSDANIGQFSLLFCVFLNVKRPKCFSWCPKKQSSKTSTSTFSVQWEEGKRRDVANVLPGEPTVSHRWNHDKRWFVGGLCIVETLWVRDNRVQSWVCSAFLTYSHVKPVLQLYSCRRSLCEINWIPQCSKQLFLLLTSRLLAAYLQLNLSLISEQLIAACCVFIMSQLILWSLVLIVYCNSLWLWM